MVQMDKEGNRLPTKLFPCDCGSEGLMVSVVEDEELNKFEGSPFINIAFWEMGWKLESQTGLSKWGRIKYAWHILRGKSPWMDMVGMRSATARNFANHILYILNKARKSGPTSKPLIDWPNKK